MIPLIHSFFHSSVWSTVIIYSLTEECCDAKKIYDVLSTFWTTTSVSSSNPISRRKTSAPFPSGTLPSTPSATVTSHTSGWQVPERFSSRRERREDGKVGVRLPGVHSGCSGAKWVHAILRSFTDWHNQSTPSQRGSLVTTNNGAEHHVRLGRYSHER